MNEQLTLSPIPEVIILWRDFTPSGLVINKEIPEERVRDITAWIENIKSWKPSISQEDRMYEESRRTWIVPNDEDGIAIYNDRVLDKKTESWSDKRRYALTCSGRVARELAEAGFIKIVEERNQGAL